MAYAWKAAVAAAAMALGAAPAWAVDIVQYRATGRGSLLLEFQPDSLFASSRTTEALFDIIMQVDRDPTNGPQPWTSDGSNYSLSLFPFFTRATFTPSSINASLEGAGPAFYTFWSLRDGAVSYQRTSVGSNVAIDRQTIIGTISDLQIMEVPVTFPNLFSFSYSEVPEPATWGMMLLGFGLAGASMRRRRSTTVTYA